MPGGFHPSADVISAWPKANYIDPETKGNELLVVTIIFTTLSTAAVLARLWVRVKYQKEIRADDVMLVVCMVPTVGIAALLILTETKYRWYRHVWDVPLHEVAGRQYHGWIVQLLFVISTTFSKLSALLLYKRVVTGSSRPGFIYLVNGAIAAQGVYGIAFTLLMILQCRPINSYWLQYSYPEPYTESFSCFYEGSVPIANAVVSVVTDFLAAMLPMVLFLQLQMPRRDKFGLAAIFGIGFIVCVTGIVRCVLGHRISYLSYDITWLSHDLWIWTYIETNLLVICTAIPPLRVYFKRILGHSRTYNSSQTQDRSTLNRRTSDYSDLADASDSGGPTDSIALDKVESGKNRPFQYLVPVPRCHDPNERGGS